MNIEEQFETFAGQPAPWLGEATCPCWDTEFTPLDQGIASLGENATCEIDGTTVNIYDIDFPPVMFLDNFAAVDTVARDCTYVSIDGDSQTTDPVQVLRDTLSPSQASACYADLSSLPVCGEP